jgi:hypothetical protein
MSLHVVDVFRLCTCFDTYVSSSVLVCSVSPCLHAFVFIYARVLMIHLFSSVHVCWCMSVSACIDACVVIRACVLIYLPFVHGWCMCFHLCMCSDVRTFLCVCICVDAHMFDTFPREAKRLWYWKLIQTPYVYFSFFMCLCLNVAGIFFRYQCISMYAGCLCVCRYACLYLSYTWMYWHANTSRNCASKVHCLVLLIKMLYCSCDWTHRAMFLPDTIDSNWSTGSRIWMDHTEGVPSNEFCSQCWYVDIQLDITYREKALKCCWLFLSFPNGVSLFYFPKCPMRTQPGREI